MAHQLTEQALMVSLNIGQMVFTKYDRRASNEVARSNGADGTAGNFNKKLISDQRLKDIQSAVNDARQWHYTHTLPWLDNGARVLPSAAYFDYLQEMQGRRAEFDNRVNLFMAHYDEMIEGSKIRLGTLFNAADYPPAGLVRSRFGFAVTFSPIPDASDFRLPDLDDAQIRTLAEQHGMLLNDITAGTVADCWQRVRSVVAAMAERLSGDEKKIFRDSLIDNARELCAILPALNITRDPMLEQARAEIESKLAAHDAHALRNVDSLRKGVAGEAQAILDKFNGCFGGAS